ncbi:MAG: ABC transporter ATP-binding protein, partial [Clostridia bacterium]|nr:ABC transporter ATP-binding protein [Clostridia bacterium]
EMDRALYAAQAKNFVDKLENGKESFISQNATNLSGGQKQRIAIARALIKDADICIFDDSFSALDLATDARLRAEIKKNYSHANIILVAQRVGTVIGADRIIVLNKGEVAGIGKHAELMETCEVYREIVETQLDPEEAAV